MPTTPPPPLPAGHMINDRYELQSFLGRGAAGDVYQALDKHMDTVVALKLLNPVGGRPAAWDEAQVLEQLRGDYLLPVYNADVVEGSDIRFITTRVMDGGDLEAVAADLGVEVAVAVRWAAQIAHAAERIHSARMLHRDIKPGNAFLDADRNAHLADLGKAIALDPTGQAPPDGTFVTVAPEAVGGRRQHCRIESDVYSLGATAFYLLSGEYPISPTGVPPVNYVAKILAGDRRRLRDLAPHVSQGLAGVIEKALSLDPVDRQSSALEFANQISTATRSDRPWRKVPCHGGHLRCLEAPPAIGQAGIRLCVFGTGKNVSAIEARYFSGRAVKGTPLVGVKDRDIPKELRRLCSSL